MEVTLAALAALAASGFAVELFRGWRTRPRPHAAAWAGAMGAYALATWALVVGLAIGWGPVDFRVFYYLGAIANIPLLAAGSVYLVLGPRAGKRFLAGAVVWLGLGLVSVLLAPIDHAIAVGGVPEGSELFPTTFELLGLTVPGPRIFAAVSGGVGSLAIVGLAISSAIRFLRSVPRLALGNLLIVLGTLSPAIGGTSTALGASGGLSVSLLVGAILLWGGYRIATSPRAPSPADGDATPLGPVGEDDARQYQ